MFFMETRADFPGISSYGGKRIVLFTTRSEWDGFEWSILERRKQVGRSSAGMEWHHMCTAWWEHHGRLLLGHPSGGMVRGGDARIQMDNSGSSFSVLASDGELAQCKHNETTSKWYSLPRWFPPDSVGHI